MEILHLIEKLSVFVFLVTSMLGSGLGLTMQRLLAPLHEGRMVLLALGLNFIIAPALAWFVTMIIPLAPGHAIALLLLGGAAGAPFVPKLVQVAREDPVLAAAVMVLLTVGTIVFMPLALPLMISGLKADPWAIARPLVLLILLPLALGILIRSCAEAFAIRIGPWLARISNGSLLLLFVLLVGLNIPALIGVLGSGTILAGIIFVTALFAVSWIFGAAVPPARGVLALASSARNFGAALVPAASSFDDPSIMVALIVNAILGIVFSFLAAGWMRKKTSEMA
jgi:predicted Na+-dependent transporter